MHSKNYQNPVVLVGNGSFSKSCFNSAFELGFPFIAADGGANHLRNFGVFPELIIGDFDSIKEPEFFEAQSELIHLSDQNSTDLEKCLDVVSAPIYYAFGFLGSAFDHSLEVLHVLRKYLDKKIIFFSENEVIFNLSKQFKIYLPVGAQVSIYPLEQTQFIASKGLKYPLNGLNLEQGKMIGTRNETTSEELEIVYESGLCACIISKKYFNNLNKTL